MVRTIGAPWARVGTCAWLAGSGAAFGGATVMGWAMGWEVWCWAGLWVVGVLAAAFGPRGKAWWGEIGWGVVYGVAACAGVMLVQVVFLDAYLANNPGYDLLAAQVPFGTPTTFTLSLIAPFGAVFGLTMAAVGGGIAWLGVRNR